jgi:hypothetical protein
MVGDFHPDQLASFRKKYRRWMIPIFGNLFIGGSETDIVQKIMPLEINVMVISSGIFRV